MILNPLITPRILLPPGANVEMESPVVDVREPKVRFIIDLKMSN